MSMNLQSNREKKMYLNNFNTNKKVMNAMRCQLKARFHVFAMSESP